METPETSESSEQVEPIITVEPTKPIEPQKSCLNCGTPLTGQFCSNCGQKDLPARQDLGDLMTNFISSFYSFESKFFKTLKDLLLRPGKIVNEYNAGKRESYYHPARMYVFLSFVFFLTLSFFVNTNDLGLGDKSKLTQAQIDSVKQVRDSIIEVEDVKIGVVSDDPAIRTVEQYDSVQLALPKEERDNAIERYFRRKSLEVENKSKGKESELLFGVLADMYNNIPQLIFFLMPIFALFLKILYARRDFYYSEHLIFTVFYYDFAYLMGTFIILCQQVSWLLWLTYVMYAWLVIFLYKSMRNVYKQRRFKTMLKFFILIVLFFMSMLLGTIGLAFLAFINL